MTSEAAPLEAHGEAGAQRDWLLLAAATIAFGFGFGINFGTAPVFAAGFLKIPRESLGVLESLREVPGLLTAGIIGLVASVAEPRLALGALLFLALGIGAQGQIHGGMDPAGRPLGFWPLVACNVFWSTGLHVWLTVQPSLTLTLSRAGHHGHGLGMMARYSAFAMMAGLLFVWLLGGAIGFVGSFAAAGAAIAAGTLFVGRIPPERGSGGLAQRLVFRPAYWRYYALMLLDGGRRQIVQTFAVLILVKEFGVELRSVAALLLVNNLLTMVASPIVGRWTDRFGERRILSCYYLLVVAVFFTYTRIPMLASLTGLGPVWVFCVVFALDNLLFTGSVGIQTYIRHTAPRSELSASLAMGLTWNHISAVTVPLAAGWIWAHYGYQRIFLYGIALALASFCLCISLPAKGETQRDTRRQAAND